MVWGGQPVILRAACTGCVSGTGKLCRHGIHSQAMPLHISPALSHQGSGVYARAGQRGLAGMVSCTGQAPEHRQLTSPFRAGITTAASPAA